MDKNLITFCIENGLPFVIAFDEPWANNPLEEYNTDTSALHYQNDDIVRPACITKEDAEIHG